MIVRGNEFRTMSPTEANATSSRSHAVLQINVLQKDRNADVNEPHTMATLSIIDLAGSERASATKNRGERLIEGANINKSLLALGSCINALCDPRKRNHVPYRNSKLTRLLKFSLGGNCKTVMIVCVSPSSVHFDETQNTLRYANRAKNIQTKVTRNVYNVNRHVKDFLKKIDEQMTLINELKQQQKDYEGVAFAKFKKLNEKKEATVKEGVARIRSAYDHSGPERQERTNNMRKLRQIERRIGMISAWIAAFDMVCETREDEEPPKGLVSMRKTAHGIQAELENSRHHYHQKLTRSNWERAIDTALQTGIRQLKDADGVGEGSEIATLIREAESLKSSADREAYAHLLEQEKGGEAATVQVLLHAHFETIAIINQILAMDEQEAVQAAKNVLGKMMSACSDAASQVIQPNGGLPLVEAFPPSRTGTPKRRKAATLIGPSPAKIKPILLDMPHLSSSPARASPRRRRFGGAKKGVAFTPKKKSPANGLKRGVRWRDDVEEGKLAEFEATPRKIDSTPTQSSADEAVSKPATSALEMDPSGSSPIPPPPETSIEIQPRSNRFQTGFLSKRGDGFPAPPVMTRFSSDSEQSPLQEIEANKAPFRSPLRRVENASSDVTPNDSAANSSSSDEDGRWTMGASDAKKIRSAIKRASLSNGGCSYTGIARQRRRSPTAASSGSPPGESSLFTAGHTRRMVRAERDGEGRMSVLSPRTVPIIKGVPPRRTTMGEERHREVSGLRSGPVRISSISSGNGPPNRGSLMPNSKSIWR